MSDPLFLVFDTSDAHCAAALVRGDTPLAESWEVMGRGQAEALMPRLQALLAGAGAGWADLTALGVGIGPGNFTGVRISVSAARGLALALGVPAIGVSGFDLMRDPAAPGAHRAEIVSLPAPRGQAHVQPYAHGAPQAAPRTIDPAAPPADLRRPGPLRVTGHRAEEIARALGAVAAPREIGDIPRRLGAATAWKWRAGDGAGARPAPLYVRPPDAAPPADPPPVLLP